MGDRTIKHPQRFFEDFDPRSEWVHKEKGDIIMIDVSGFEKDQLKVFLETNGKISVSGQRPIEGTTKWIKFRKEFSKPDNCNVNEIRARFDCGILYVILPKQKLKQNQNQNQEDDDDAADGHKSKPTISTAAAAAAAKEIMEAQTSVNSGPRGGAEEDRDGVVVRHAMGLTKLRNLLLILVVAILVLGLGRKLKDKVSKFIK